MKKYLSLCFFTLFALTIHSCSSDDDDNDEVKEDFIEIKTEFGDIYIWLYDETPLHKENFLQLASEDFYDGTTFHRIIDNFMIQGGDPNSKDADPSNDGSGGPGYTIEAEIMEELKHDYGALGAARLGNNVNPEKRSSGSQFYIVEKADGTDWLNMEYTVFGMVMQGMPVVEAIAVQPKNSSDRPNDDIIMDVNVLSMTKEQIQANYNFIID